MSTIDTEGVHAPEGVCARCRFLAVLGVVLLLAGGAALYFEPLLVLGRVRDAVLANDVDAQRHLIAPHLIGDDLHVYLEASRPGPGIRIAHRYESFSRFVVTGRPTRPDPDVWGHLFEVQLTLERHGLSWWLADVGWATRSAIHDTPESPPRPLPDPAGGGGADPFAPRDRSLPSPRPPGLSDDSLPAFGTYVYVEELPEAIQRVAPVYPEQARLDGAQGTVLVQALVGRDGLVRDARIQKSIPGLDDAALEAVRKWRFKPAMALGRPVAVWVAIPVRFSLH
jgi:protein TonB